MASAANPKPNKPANTRFKQQNLPAWQPVLSPRYVITTFFIIGLIFIPIGIILLSISNKVVEVSVQYDNRCDMKRQPDAGNYFCRTTVEFNVPKDMKAPVYLYYKLDGFYQNHRRYAMSKSDAQLAGSEVGLVKDCEPHRFLGDNASDNKKSDNPKSNSTIIYNPCGLIAYSMFNDTFVLRNDDNEVVCNGPNPDGKKCTKKGIAWSSDLRVKYRRGNNTNWKNPKTYDNEDTHPLPDVLDEDFMVWMRTSALPSFRKLHRIIKDDVKAGKYSMEINQNFPVFQFNGRKEFVLSTTTAFGGKNIFMGAAYIVVGSLSVIIGAIFLIMQIRSRRNRQVLN